MSCVVSRRCGSDPELLWLRHRPVAIAQIRPLAWESPYAVGAAQKKAKRQKKTKKKKKIQAKTVKVTVRRGRMARRDIDLTDFVLRPM